MDDRRTDLHDQLQNAALFAQRRRLLYPYFALTQTIEVGGVKQTLRHIESGKELVTETTWKTIVDSAHNPLTASMARMYAQLMVAISRPSE